MDVNIDRLETLRNAIMPVLRPYGVRLVAIFGSFARGEATEESDIDLLVDFEEPRRQPLGLLTWVHLERELSELLGRRVEMISRQGLSVHLRPHVKRDMVVIYAEEAA